MRRSPRHSKEYNQRGARVREGRCAAARTEFDIPYAAAGSAMPVAHVAPRCLRGGSELYVRNA